MIDLIELAERMQQLGLMNKSFFECTRSEIMQIADAFMSSIGDDVPTNGWQKPYLDDRNQLIIPNDCHPDYRWWQSGGKSVWQILVELEAPFDVARRYVSRGFGSPLTEQDWNEQIAPF